MTHTDRGGRDNVVPEQLQKFAAALKVEDESVWIILVNCLKAADSQRVLSGSYFSTAQVLQVSFSHRIKGRTVRSKDCDRTRTVQD